jgi:hypothetical protein
VVARTVDFTTAAAAKRLNDSVLMKFASSAIASA